MQSPIEVLKLTSNGLVFDTEIFVSILDKIGDKNIAILSVNGRPRTGKSLLLNYFLRFLKYKDTNDRCVNRAKESLLTGFNLRTTDKSITNGIWLWSEPFVVTASDGSEMVLLLMETRCNFEDKANYRECGIIFAISLLLSSTIILNIKSDLSENVLKFVECFARFAQSINGESQTELFQRLVFLVRDWDNECAYRYGYHDAYTTDDNNYLKSMINPHSNHCFEDQNTRKSLLACFSDISSYLMPHPGKNVTKPWFCGEIDLIDREFSEKIEDFVHLIIGKLEPKTNANRKLTGNSLKQYLNKWQQNTCGSKPEDKSLCSVVSNSAELDLAFESACNLYETRIRSFIESNPIDDENLNDYHISAAQKSWDYLITKLNKNVSEEFLDGMRENFRQRISETLEFYINKNMNQPNKFAQQTDISGLAKLYGKIENCTQKPKNILCVQLPCPGSYDGSCEPVDQYWCCFKCNEILEYGFDGYLYCLCGRADVYSFEFKCNSKNHPMNYVQFNERVLKLLLSNKEINILIMGETGVGKSTWINGFVNYLTYTSLAEAKDQKLLSLIASTFTMTDNNYQRRVITCGEDPNEVFITGQSATQEPKAYVFDNNSKLIRIIDTPGIGDTRGIEQDKKNFDMILRYLSNFDKLHGICILLKPNNARLGVMFRFFIKELLTHLHRDASRNIVFCFTNARSTFYRPGDTFPALESLLGENRR